MISTTLLICIGVASAMIVVALIARKLSRLPANASAENAKWRDMTFAGVLLNLAAAVGIARAQVEQSDGGHGWHGGHLDHGAGGGFSDGGGFGGGDAGGGGI